MDYPNVSKLSYSAVRKKLKPGDIWLCCGNGVFSKMIRKATGSAFSHVGFVMPLESIDRVVVMESVESIGVRVVPTSQYVSNYSSSGKKYNGRVFLARHKQFPETATAAAHRKFTQFAVDQLGFPYDHKEIISIATRIALGCKRKSRRDKAYICSEYAWECYQSIGVEIALNKRGFITPADFAADPNVEIKWEIRL